MSSIVRHYIAEFATKFHSVQTLTQMQASHHYLTNVQCWNRHNHGQTIHPRQKFISRNLLQMSCIAWDQKNQPPASQKK